MAPGSRWNLCIVGQGSYAALSTSLMTSELNQASEPVAYKGRLNRDTECAPKFFRLLH